MKSEFTLFCADFFEVEAFVVNIDSVDGLYDYFDERPDIANELISDGSFFEVGRKFILVATENNGVGDLK